MAHCERCARHNLIQRGTDGYPIGADELMRKAYGKIPNATAFQHNYVSVVPVTVHGWEWSVTFGAWSALVTFPDGWTGFTWSGSVVAVPD